MFFSSDRSQNGLNIFLWCHSYFLHFIKVNIAIKFQKIWFAYILMLNLHSMIWPKLNHSIANSSLFPTSLYLHSNFSPKKMVFLKKKNLPKKKFCFFTYFLCNFSVRTLWFFQKNLKKFLTPKYNSSTTTLCRTGI